MDVQARHCISAHDTVNDAMVIDTEVLPFFVWLPTAVWYWLTVAGALCAAAVAMSYLVAATRNGPVRGARLVRDGLRGGIADLVFISPRRTLALARLAIQEALHRRVLVAFGLFAVILLFATWYLDEATDNPARLYLSFVLTTTTYLVLLLALFLSVFSLPADIASRTIYTIASKPVRASELVLGRMIGFALVGTILLFVTGLISYVFVLRGLNHTHEIVASNVVAADSQSPRRGRTEPAQNHRHDFQLDADGRGQTDVAQGHWHEVTATGSGKQTVYRVGPPRGALTARVPLYGKLSFRDRQGTPTLKGYNVGNEWTYRSFIEGGTLSAAIWRFTGLTAPMFPNGLPIEMTVRVFRTHKGDISKGILGRLVLRNPQTGVSSAIPFVAKEFTTDVKVIPRQLTDQQGKSIDLFDDLVTPQGELEVQMQCLEGEQYFGMAQPDLYLRASDASFTTNFVKGYIGIWLQMMLVTAAGVMFSTFLSGPVAMLATFAMMLAGSFVSFMTELASGTVPGGGPVESAVRIFTQRNLTTKLEPGLSTSAIKMFDEGFRGALKLVLAVLPDFSALSDVDYVVHGFDIPANLLLVHGVTAVAYLVPVFVAAFLFFRTREVAR